MTSWVRLIAKRLQPQDACLSSERSLSAEAACGECADLGTNLLSRAWLNRHKARSSVCSQSLGATVFFLYRLSPLKSCTIACQSQLSMLWTFRVGGLGLCLYKSWGDWLHCYIVEVGNSHKTSAGSRTTLLYRRVLKQIEACVAVSTWCVRAQESFTAQGLSATLKRA